MSSLCRGSRPARIMSNRSRSTETGVPAMAMIEINKNPSRRDLLVFGAALLLLFGVIGALRWHAGSPGTAIWWWIGGFVLSTLLVAVPPAGRWLYLGWLYAVYPI